MKKYLKLGALSLAASALLIGCGSASTTSNTDTQTGYFIDAPVAGLSYKTTSGNIGVTDTFGKFFYKSGDKVEFKIGKLTLGEVEPEVGGLVTPKTLTDNTESQTLMLQLLQSLDIDNNPLNGITIPNDVVTSLNTLATDINIVDMNETTLLENSTLSDFIDEDYDGNIDVTETIANAHFNTSILQWQNGTRPEQIVQQQPGGQGNGAGGTNTGGTNTGANFFDPTTYPDSNISQETRDSIAFMGNEERLAYDVYMGLYNYHLDKGYAINQFKNIAERSEVQHIQITLDLAKKYALTADNLTEVNTALANSSEITLEQLTTPELMGQYDLPVIQDLYDMLMEKGKASPKDALEVGCMIEVVDIEDLDERIAIAEDANATDIVAGFNILRDGSYNHYWGFDKGLKNLGYANGCNLGISQEIDGHTYVFDDKNGIYPTRL